MPSSLKKVQALGLRFMRQLNLDAYLLKEGSGFRFKGLGLRFMRQLNL